MSEHTTLSVQLVKDNTSLDGVEIISGGMSTCPTWEEYLNGCEDIFKPYLQLIKEHIEANNLIGTTGEQQNTWTFLFSDGYHIGFTWRAWGDLMQAIVGKREGYMAYYM